MSPLLTVNTMPIDFVKPYCFNNGVLSAERCDRLINYSEAQGFTASLAGGSVDLAFRDSRSVWLEEDDVTREYYDYFEQAMLKANASFFQFDITSITKLQYARYDVGHYFNWHLDVRYEPVVPPDEYVKFVTVLMLSGPDEYEGGELVLNTLGNAETATSFKLPRGEMILINPWIPHRINPITSGVRKTMLSTASGPRWR